MTVLGPPPDVPKVQLPSRSAIHAGHTEVLVVGGGPAGFGAAMGAAAAGAEVVLVERYGFLGGNATAALVMPLMSFHNEMKQAVGGADGRLLPTDHGEGEPVVAGVLWMLLDRLVRAHGAVSPSPDTGYTVPFDPELFKLTTYDMLAGCGVRLLLHSFASDCAALPDGGTRVVFETKSGPVVIDAAVVVDCTGDGDLAAAAGAPYEVGRPEDGLTQPMTLMFRVGNVDRDGFLGYVRDHPDQWRGVHGLWDLVQQARDAGELDLPREDILFFATPHLDEVSVNSTRFGGLGTSVWDLTRAELVMHHQMAQIARFLHDRVPGFGDSYVIQSGVQVGVRETRRVLGDYQLTGEDVLSARSFPDVVARGAYPVDIHNPNGPGTILRRLPQGASYDIPLRTLLPRDVDGLLVAGRCISGDHVAHSSYRIMPISMATGQAAGVCAALSARAGKAPREIPAEQVQRVLRAQGASLPDG
ncbi:FAD-dependent oxidoreductase [Dactylosporangium sp. AC04546]|uniref:FAD-dependent oxidoreductase n=1 Tax=Dactylosporangium sp. AC04546 TaxID=2862460 RepID=UPI001EDE2694|nr:FAD-dependent oxidoreductase [Dactylosporangium sp. AC04546]WVK81948.1 FAD-dependent oxidoreductase [Dactylosporangium sp. AC04546]